MSIPKVIRVDSQFRQVTADEIEHISFNASEMVHLGEASQQYSEFRLHIDVPVNAIPLSIRYPMLGEQCAVHETLTTESQTNMYTFHFMVDPVIAELLQMKSDLVVDSYEDMLNNYKDQCEMWSVRSMQYKRRLLCIEDHWLVGRLIKWFTL